MERETSVPLFEMSEINETNPELAMRLLASKAIDHYVVPVDPMDDLQCESCP